MPRQRRISRELEAAAAHVAYETETMLFAADHLDSMHGSPPVTPIGKEADIFLESFLLHFRNLRDFLCPGSRASKKPDNIIASDFLGEDEPRSLDPEIGRAHV